MGTGARSEELRLRHLEPKRELIVSVDPTLSALNAASDTHFEKPSRPATLPSIGFASHGSLLPGKVVAGLPVMALNVDNVDVNFSVSEAGRCRLSSVMGIP